jgi:general stress protein 26
MAVSPTPEEPPKEPPRREPPLQEPPHKDPPPHEPPRRDPEPEVPVIDPPPDKEQPPPEPEKLPPPPAEVRNRARLHEILADAGTAMMITHGADGYLQHRPATVARIDDHAMFFATALDAATIVELTADPRIDVVVHDRGRCAAIRGTAEITRDRALIDRLWNAAWVSWFPAGVRARELAIVIVRPQQAEYWDGHGMRGVAVSYAR